jgi:DNA modification methylase
MNRENATTATRLQPIVSQPLPLDSIICGDNVETMATFPDASIDLVVTSPPYDNLRTYGGHSWEFEGVAQQLWRVIKPGGVVVWVVADATIDGSETGTSFRQAVRFMEIGFRLHDTMIYQKTNGPFPEKARYNQTTEFMFVLSKGKPNAFNPIIDKPNSTAGNRTPAMHARQPDGRNAEIKAGAGYIAEFGMRGNAWLYYVGGQSESKDRINAKHPATFPSKLARDHILSWNNEGDIVLDPFNGSGTTTKMAREMGRRWIGIEVNEEYCEIARKRLAQKLLDFGDAG